MSDNKERISRLADDAKQRLREWAVRSREVARDVAQGTGTRLRASGVACKDLAQRLVTDVRRRVQERLPERSNVARLAEHSVETINAARDEAEFAEFQGLLADVGAEPPKRKVKKRVELDIAQRTIDELTENLARLQPIADELAEAEKARLLQTQELEHLRSERVGVTAREADEELRKALAAAEKEIAQLRKTLAKKERNEARLEERHEKMRAKVEEKTAAATERWHQIQELRRERKSLKAKLAQAEKRAEERPGPRPTTKVGAGSPSELMRVEAKKPAKKKRKRGSKSS